MPDTSIGSVIASLGAVGTSLYLLWHIVTKTLPAQAAAFTETLREVQAGFREELAAERTARGEAETRHRAERDALMARVFSSEPDRPDSRRRS